MTRKEDIKRLAFEFWSASVRYARLLAAAGKHYIAVIAVRLSRGLRHGLQWLSPKLLMATSRLPHYARLMRLDKLIGFYLLLWPTLWGLWLASSGKPDERVFAVFMLGTLILRSAGCIINDFADRNIDDKVRRTADRPLAAGVVKPVEALILFAILMLIGLALVLTLNEFTVQLAFVGALLAVVYPFMKRVIAAPQLVLGAAFAWGVPMAFAAQTGAVPRIGWLLFLVSLIWVVIYDTQYAMVDREDDLRIGVHSTAIMFGEMDRVILAALQLFFFGSLLLIGRSEEMGSWYFLGLAFAAALAIYQAVLIRNRDPDKCFEAFRNNAWFGAAIFFGILLEFLFR